MASAKAEQWAQHFPAACPPAAAQPRSAKVFVFVRTDPPTQRDFRSQVERQRFSPDASHEAGKHCQACGLSVSDTLADDGKGDAVLVAANDKRLEDLLRWKRHTPRHLPPR